MKNCVKVSMDKPNANLKMFEMVLEERRNNTTYPDVLGSGYFGICIHYTIKNKSSQTFSKDQDT